MTESQPPESPDAPETVAAKMSDEVNAEPSRDGVDWSRVVAFGVLPAIALLLAGAAGFFKWQDNSVRYAEPAGVEAVQAARDGVVAMLSYESDQVEEQLGAARGLLTGSFEESYSELIDEVVIPGAKEQQISTVATVPGAAAVSADPHRASVLLFVNQTINMGDEPPTSTASAVRVTLDKVAGRWLISDFEPV